MKNRSVSIFHNESKISFRKFDVRVMAKKNHLLLNLFREKSNSDTKIRHTEYFYCACEKRKDQRYYSLTKHKLRQ